MTKTEFLLFLQEELRNASDGDVNIDVTNITINTAYEGEVLAPTGEMVSFTASIPGCVDHHVMAHAIIMPSPISARLVISYVFVRPVQQSALRTAFHPWAYSDVDMMYDSRYTIASIVAKAAAHGIIGFTEL